MIMTSAKAESVAEPTRVSFEVYRAAFRDANFPDSERQNTKGIAFIVDLDVLDYIKWKNRVWTNGHNAQLRTVGWEYDISIALHENVSVFHYHHSQHSMDEFTNAARFPLRNYFGMRFNFLGGE